MNDCDSPPSDTAAGGDPSAAACGAAASGAAGEPGAAMPRKALILDVDGVVFRGQFLLALARRAGLRPLLAVLADAFRFNTGRLTIDALLTRGYGRLRGLPGSLLHEVFEAMPRTGNAAAAVRHLVQEGYEVLLLSSGVPDPLVKELAREMGAGQGEGITVHSHGGVLTGEVGGDLAQNDGKVQFARRWLDDRGLTWDQVVVVADDNNNLGLMQRAGLSIGIHARRKVRRAADRLAEAGNLASIIPLVAPREAVPPRPMLSIEIRRRLVHMTAIIWPFIALASLPLAMGLLGAAAAAFSLSEFFRINGLTFPLVGYVTRLSLRPAEMRGFAAAPLTLTAGVLACLPFPPPIPFLAVGIVAFCDTAAGLVGQFLGRVKLPYNPGKTLEGTLASFSVAAGLSLCFLPPGPAVAVAAAAAFIESLPLGIWDNLIVPVAVALLCLALV